MLWTVIWKTKTLHIFLKLQAINIHSQDAASAVYIPLKVDIIDSNNKFQHC